MQGTYAISIVCLILLFPSGVRLHVYKDACPALCRCDDDVTGTVIVSCIAANLTRIPKLPQNTLKFDSYFKGTIIQNIQNFAFSALPLLRTIQLESRERWTIGDQAFSGLQNLVSLTMRVLFPNTVELDHDIFTGMSSLKAIHLNSIPVSISDDSPLCPLSSLSEILLTDTSLESLKFGKCFLNFRELKTLSIFLNNVTEVRKEDFANLRQSPLTKLSILRSRLKMIEDTSFNMFPYLQYTSLMGNKLSELPSNLFHGNISKDFDLILQNNEFRKLPCDILERIKSCGYLNMRSNKMDKLTPCPNVSCKEGLTDLNVLDNKLNKLDGDSFNQIAYLELKILRIQTKRVAKGTFSPLVGLKHLELFYQLSTDMVEDALSNMSKTNIEYMKLFKTKTTHLTSTVFRGLRSTQLKSLVLNHCNIASMENETFTGLKYLETLDLSDNKIVQVPRLTFLDLTSLKQLIISGNRLFSLPELQSEWGLSNSIENLQLSDIQLGELYRYTFRGLNKLSNLSLSRNSLRRFESISVNGTSLYVLDLSHNKIAQLLAQVCEHVSSLRDLNLESNLLQLNKDTKFNPFDDCFNLEKLRLGSATISSTYSYLPVMFANLTKLKKLSLRSCNIRSLPKAMFSKTESLEQLYMEENNIIEWPPELFKACSKLNTLLLYKNNIGEVHKQLFKYMPSLKVLELNDNPLVCDCGLVECKRWVLRYHVYLSKVGKPQTMMCASPDKWKGRYYVDFDMDDSECIDHTPLTLSVSLSSFLLLVLGAVILIYRYRYHIRYGLYFIRTRYNRMKEETNDTDYKFDAFVAYCSNDSQWIMRGLIPEMETERGFKFCIHHRNWLAGPSIVDNIIESIEDSRRTILVVSNQFAKSYWCQVETSLSQTRLMEGQRNSLVIVVLEEVATKNMSGSLRHLLTSHTYLPWPSDENAQNMFWKSLTRALKKPKSNVIAGSSPAENHGLLTNTGVH